MGDDWQDRAACKGDDGPNYETFFPVATDIETIRKAQAICGRCPVKVACLEDALGWPEAMDFGIRGGYTEEQRQEMRTEPALRPESIHPGHGDYRGYLWEIRHLGKACRECTDGRARYERSLVESKRIKEGDGASQHGGRWGYKLGCRGECCSRPEREYMAARRGR